MIRANPGLERRLSGYIWWVTPYHRFHIFDLGGTEILHMEVYPDIHNEYQDIVL